MSDFVKKIVRFRKKYADLGEVTPKCLKYKRSDKEGSILKQQGQTVLKTATEILTDIETNKLADKLHSRQKLQNQRMAKNELY